jgi:hypothetical protein
MYSKLSAIIEEIHGMTLAMIVVFLKEYINSWVVDFAVLILTVAL